MKTYSSAVYDYSIRLHMFTYIFRTPKCRASGFLDILMSRVRKEQRTSPVMTKNSFYYERYAHSYDFPPPPWRHLQPASDNIV